MWLLIISFLTATATWISPSNPKLPRADQCMAIGNYNGVIHLLGGSDYPRQVIKYDINNNIFIDEGVNVSSFVIYGYGQFYTQIHNIIYMIDPPTGATLSTYDMTDNTFVNQWRNETLSTDVGPFACLASTTNYLFFTGGYNTDIGYLNDVQIFHFVSYQWLPNTSPMTVNRSRHCCIADESSYFLYAFGGYDGSYMSHSERINIDSLIGSALSPWDDISSLDRPTDRTRCVLYKEDIYVLGGYTVYRVPPGKTISEPVHTVHIYNSFTGIRTKLYTFPDALSYAVILTAATTVSNVIYGFGGQSDGGSVSSWMYNVIPTMAPTQHPTTSDPTMTPIQNPSHFPTSNPSLLPSISPSNDPSKTPSMSPTLIPSQSPSLIPTEYPTIITSAPTTAVPTTGQPTPQLYCNDVVVYITNINVLLFNDLESTNTFVIFITNATFHGIGINAVEYGIEDDEFYVRFKDNIIENNEYIVNVTESVCMYQETALPALFNVIREQSNAISTFITNQIISYFRKEYDANMKNVKATIHLTETSPNDNKEDAENGFMSEITSVNPLYIAVGVIGGFMLFAIIGLMDAKCLRTNDYFSVKRMVIASFEVLDTVMDILFAILLTFMYNTNGELQFIITMICSWSFIVIPVIFSIIQLVIKSRKTWIKQDTLRVWLMKYSKWLYILSIVTGSSYTAIKIVNCGFCQIPMFNMKLNEMQQIKYETKRIYGVVLLENIPQVAVQIWYLTVIGLDWIPIFSVIFSLISMITAVLTMFTQRAIIKNQHYVEITFDIIGDKVTPKISLKTNGIKYEIGKILNINRNLIQIPQPHNISSGVSFMIQLLINDPQRIPNYKLIDNDNITKIISKQWHLNEKEIAIKRLENKHINTSQIQPIHNQHPSSLEFAHKNN